MEKMFFIRLALNSPRFAKRNNEWATPAVACQGLAATRREARMCFVRVCAIGVRWPTSLYVFRGGLHIK